VITRIRAQGRDWTLELRPDGEDNWEVSTEGGAQIGRVYKSTYTYSPPTHRGSRIAKYHKSVKCWRMEEGPKRSGYSLDSGFGFDRYGHGPYETRKAALEAMVSELLERSNEERAVIDFSRAHSEARFRLSSNGIEHVGIVINRHPGGLVVRDPTKPGGEREIRVRRRQIREDRGSVLQVQLRKGGRWEPIVNAMFEEEQ